MFIHGFYRFVNEGTFSSDAEIAIYNGEDGMTYIEKRPDGTFYGYNDSFDFDAENAEELLGKLTEWGYTLVAGGIDEGSMPYRKNEGEDGKDLAKKKKKKKKIEPIKECAESDAEKFYQDDLLGTDEGMDMWRAATKKYPDYNQDDKQTKEATKMILNNLLKMVEGEVSSEVKDKLYNKIWDGMT